jgi:hypothetical protein
MKIKKFDEINEEFTAVKGISNESFFLEEIYNKFRTGNNNMEIVINSMKKIKSVKHTEPNFFSRDIDTYHDIYLMSYEIKPIDEKS